MEFLFEDCFGQFWYKSEQNTYNTYYFNKNKKLIEIKKYFDTDIIKDILKDSSEKIWILEENNIKELNKGKIISTTAFPDNFNCSKIETIGSAYLSIQGKHNKKIFSLLFDKNSRDYTIISESAIRGVQKKNKVFITTLNLSKGVTCETHSFMTNNSSIFKTPSKWEKEKFYTFYDKALFDGQLKKNYFFFAPYESGLASFKNGIEKSYQIDDGLPTGKFISEAVDSNGNLWFAFIDGLARFIPQEDNFISYTEEDGVPNDINDIESDGKGGLWIATDKGLVKFTEPVYNANLVISYFKADSLIFSPQDKVELSYQHNTVRIKFLAVAMQFPEKIKYSVFLNGLSDEWTEYSSLREKLYEQLPFGRYDFRFKAKLKNGKILDGPSISFTIFPPWYKTWWFYSILVIFLVSLFYTVYKARIRILEKTQKKLEKEVETRTYELSEANIELEEKSFLIIEKNIKLTDSIEYASLIQNSILPKEKEISQYIQNYFIIWKPKDIVGGDFYWFFPIPNSKNYIISVIDCTVHGVPGAFMSMTANSILNNIVREKKIYEPDKILNLLHKEIRYTLRQKSKESQQDGMDISICYIDVNLQEIHFSGAMQFLFLIKSGQNEIDRIRGNRFSIGGRQKEEERIFTKHIIQYNSDDSIYLLSDGLADQKVRIDGKETKFKIKRVKEMYLKYNLLPIKEQKIKIEEELAELQGEIEQRDDIVVVGVKL
ncbi:MAG: SpoIIE family protein phosphatase [Candidatus Cloacimonetes bacterium]|nr:SpoIIE family protein phosphatase [Candidatus Cloacimonadota bacterium]